MKYKMVIFDLDGTILNTIEDLCCAVNHALKQYQIQLINIETCKANLGHGIKHLVYESSGRSEKIDDLLKEFRRFYSINYNNFTKPYDGIVEVLDYCINNNIKIGVYTNKVEDIAINLCKDHFGDRFDFVYGDIEGRQRKPNPEFLLKLICELGYDLSEVLYVGDSDVDIKTCLNAKIDGVFLSYGFRSKNDLEKLTNKILDSAKDLIKYLG